MTKKVKKSTLTPFSIITALLIVLAHIAIGVATVFAYRYFAIYPTLFYSILGIVICVLLIVDIVFFVGYSYKDTAMKIITCVMAVFLLLGGTVGSFYLNKINSTVGSVIKTNNTKEDQFENISGVFVSKIGATDKENHVIKYDSLNSIKGKIIGIVPETTEGVATIAQQLLDSEKIDYAVVEYQTNDQLLSALYDEKIDVAVFLNGYRGIFERDENTDYSGVLSELNDFYTFDKDVKVASTASNKDISKEPFNILLIGYSRTDIGSPVGLADAIIIASVNPQTYTVSMMSIARDSYVPISCYGGTYDKINSARGTSRACFIQTVEDYTGMKMDFYMEADYEAVVEVVGALDGIVISNPVDFTLDGIFVPAGTYNAYGWQVLEFCRERHHMPNGDFDRQQHQKEVIIAIAEKLIKSADITLFLKAIEAAGDKFSTNLTLNQLTSMFNMILNTNNYTGLGAKDLINFHQLRITGYASWYYNYSMHLPLWIYKIYNGSYKEAIDHAKKVLGVNVNTSDQNYLVSFDINTPYERPLLYSTSYNEEQVHEEMPPYYPNIKGMSYNEAVAWAAKNGVKLNVTYIRRGDEGYNENLEGYIVSQYPRYGMLISEYPVASITVMGNGKIKLPKYDGWTYEEAKEWCKENDFEYSKRSYYVPYGDSRDGYVHSMKVNDDGDKIYITRYVSVVKNATPTDDGSDFKCNNGYTMDKNTNKCVVLGCEHSYDEGTIVEDATCTEEGLIVYVCKKCESEKTVAIPLIPHDYEVTNSTSPTCDSPGIDTYECEACGNKYTVENSPATGTHNFGDPDENGVSVCSECGYKTEPVAPSETE